jgi:hypothetical protein
MAPAGRPPQPSSLTARMPDARRMVAQLTGPAVDALEKSAQILDDLRARWAETQGKDRLQALEAELRRITPPDLWRLDVPGWYPGPHGR